MHNRMPLAFLYCMAIAMVSFGAHPAAAADGLIVDSCAYGDDQSARQAWTAMTGSAAVRMADVDGARALCMPCNFKGTKIERASWDRDVRLDMTRCRGLKIRMRCRNMAAVGNFSLYLQSGNGWYRATFAPNEADGWSDIVIPKENTELEESPAGWSKIRTIRISAWRGQDSDAEVSLSQISLIGQDADIAVIRGESVAKHDKSEMKSVCAFSEGVAQRLHEMGLGFSMISDLDVDARRLDQFKLIILPHNPEMPENVADAIASRLESGGKLLAFYVLPANLGKAAGFQIGRFISGRASNDQFNMIKPVEAVLAGAPAAVGQHSWNIHEAKPIAGRSRVAAEWFDKSGRDTGYAAVLASDRAVLMTHVLLDDDGANQTRLLLAMAGHLVPDLWKQAATGSLRDIRVGPCRDFDEARQALQRRESAAPAQLAQTLALADQARARAVQLQQQGKPIDAIAAAQEARHLLMQAYALAQKSVAGERRALWCHSAFGLPGRSWDEAIHLLAQNGFNAILPNMLWGGVAYYDSRVLPAASEVKDKGDQIALCAAACRKYGIQCHVWKVNWNMGGHAPREFAARMKREGRTQVRFDGSANDQWLCPSHPENQKLEIDAMVEVASRYDIDGIHFDYIRYPDRDGCFCPRCRQAFEKQIGRAVNHWPADVRRDAALERQWLDFRRENITRVVAGVSLAARAVKPKIQISAAVFGNWSVDRDLIGQDWKLWCERGYLDFVCPMDYTAHNAQFQGLVRRQLEWAGKVPVYPGIGLSCWPVLGREERLIEQINIARECGARGFTIFQYDQPSAQSALPMCGQGVTRTR